ncbi:LIC_13387 family protein [Kribbella soli]|uniref:Uncharacterized protein n=1 Tax=Kribbella soli TaxID=1124743 RepID=A0A4R0HGA2_9ACTN|nr:hypothetical protein [Kribbella soli]TCC07902.1 hypothetical protein E0H45_18350 [Kribbella soli]
MNLTAFRVGAVAWGFTGLGHDILEFVLPGDPELAATMRASTIDVGPLQLNAESLSRGVSVAMGLAMIVVGALLWMIADVLRNDPDRLRPFGIIALVATVLALGLAVLWVPGPPLVTFSVATVAFVAAFLLKKPLPASASGSRV